MSLELIPDQRITRGPVLTNYTNPSQSAALPTELKENIFYTQFNLANNFYKNFKKFGSLKMVTTRLL